MRYFLKKTSPSKKGVYLQIYYSNYTKGIGCRNHFYKKIGYVSDLIASGVEDPIAEALKEVDKLNAELINKPLQISDNPPLYNIGFFLIKSMFDKLNIDNYLNALAINFNCKYKFSDLFRTMVYSQVISPGSKLKAFEKVIPSIYDAQNYSYDQILDFTDFVGKNYHRFVEIINHGISENWDRDLNTAYFDCTNYYFEIDLQKDYLKKGPSKENRRDPLLGQALMLDANQIPIDTEFYPGNESEKPFLRNRIEDMKNRNNVTGKVIQVADKGLNCARNIYAAVVEADDGYIFSKSIRGKNVSKSLKEWILKEEDPISPWKLVYDKEGKLKYKYRTCNLLNNDKIYDNKEYEYSCKVEPNDDKETKFCVREKRILTFNPSLARKQREEILKQVDKLRTALSYKKVLKEELGDAAKFVNLKATTEDGEKVEIVSSIDEDKVNEALSLCGYNLLITSEINADPEAIYNTYHNLWRIEESFRVMKTYLDARPVFLSKKNTIFGHFLICYTALTIMRLLELKTFDDELAISRLFDFVRNCKVVKIKDGSYINCSSYSEELKQIKNKLGLSKLSNAFLSTTDIKNILETELD